MKKYKIRIDEYVQNERYDYQEMYSQVVEIEDTAPIFTTSNYGPLIGSTTVTQQEYIKNIIKAVNNI